DQAVRGNLAGVPMNDPDGPRLEELEQALRRAARVMEALDRNLQGPPVPARDELRQALQGPDGKRVKDLEKTVKQLEKRLKGLSKKAGGKDKGNGGKSKKERGEHKGGKDDD